MNVLRLITPERSAAIGALVVTNREQVAARPCLDRFRRAERAPELGDLPLHLRDRGDGRAPGVQLVREPLDRHDAVRVQQQDRQRRPLPRPAEPDRAVLADDLERPQHAELEHGCDGSRSVAAR